MYLETAKKVIALLLKDAKFVNDLSTKQKAGDCIDIINKALSLAGNNIDEECEP